MSVRLACAVALLVACVAPAASAQWNCGQVNKGNDIFQNGRWRAVGVNAYTDREISLCLADVQVEAWVEGVGGAQVARAAYSANVQVYQAVPSYGVWSSISRHWVITGLFWDVWLDWGWLHATTEVVNYATSSGNRDAGDCQQRYERDMEYGDGCESPILLDTAFDGYRLTSVEDGVRFDLDADGSAEQVAWTRPDTDDAWLALDRNGNGVIDDGSELFGNATHAYADRVKPTTANGFEALRFTEGPSYGQSRPDGVIDRRDAIFARLLLWRDVNHNGVSEPDELQPASESALVAIATEYRLTRRTDRHGNEFRQRAKSYWNVDGAVASHPVFDVWLRTDR